MAVSVVSFRIEEDPPARLDKALSRDVPDEAALSRSRLGKLIEGGAVAVNGATITNPRFRTGEGDEIEIRVEEADESHIGAEEIPLEVLYEDDDLIVVNKPAGMVVHPAPGSPGGTLVNALIHHCGESLSGVGGEKRPGIVHRLDKDTSGVLLLARTDRVARALSEALRHRNVRKIYWAAVAGVPYPRAGSIKYGLLKAPGRGRGGEAEKMRCIHPSEVATTEGAKRAHTDYAVLTNLGTRMAWLALVPITGRTHQLRAHIAEVGHPIIGDGKYGGSQQENLGDGWGAGIGGDGISNKLHLHARTIIFEHPITKKEITITAPLPLHMQKTWEYVGWDVTHAPLDPFNMPDA